MIKLNILNNIIKYLFFVLLLISCEKDKIIEQETIYENPIAEEPIKFTEANKKYLALGDSYTVGQSVLPENSFPYILVTELSKKGIFFDKPRVIAQTGWTTTNLSIAIQQQTIENNYDLVTLLIGVNNQYQGKSIEGYRKEYVDLLKQAINLANSTPNNVVVLSIPDWGVSPYAINFNFDVNKISSEIDAFNKIKEEETLKLGVQFVNITDICRLAKGYKLYFADDELHFSGSMHLLWVYEILKFKF